MRFDIDVQGLPELQRVLEGLPKRLRDVVLRQALRRAAVPVLARARSNLASQVRVTGEATDPIYSGLRIVPGRRRRGAVSIIVRTPTRKELGIPADAAGYYPAYIELGTRKTPAQPYMRTALAQTRAAATTIIRQELSKGLDAIARGTIRARRPRGG